MKVKNINPILLVALILTSCAPAATETMALVATPIVSFTATPIEFPTVTPIPQPVQIGSLGSGVMSDVFRSPDGRLIAIGIGNVLHWYDSKTFTELGSLPLRYAVPKRYSLGRLLQLQSEAVFFFLLTRYMKIRRYKRRSDL